MLPVEDVEEAAENIRLSSYFGIPLFVLGLIGNGIIIRLMIKREVRRYSSSIFLLGLAISDTVILFYEVVDDIAIHVPSVTAYDILYGYNTWRCRFGVFISQTARTVSAWLIVGMAAELCVATSCPNKRRVIYYRNRTLYVSMAVVLVAVAAGFPFLVLAREAVPGVSLPVCSSDYEVFFLVYSQFVLKGVTQCLVPILFVFVCNLISYCSLSKQIEQQRDEEKYVSVVDRRGLMTKNRIQAKNTIYVLTILYILTVTPSTVAEVYIMVNRFFADFAYTHFWNIVINTTSVILMANYAIKFYCIVLFGREYRGAFAGKLNLYDVDDDDDDDADGNHSNVNKTTPVPNGVVSNGQHEVRHLYDVQLEVRPSVNN